MILFNILTSMVHASEVKVEFRLSKMHGFYNFLETIIGKPHRSELVLKAFQESKYNNPTTAKLIDDLRVSDESMPEFEFNGFPKSRNAGADIELILNVQSIFSKDLNDLANRSLGLFPMADHARYFKAAKQLLPIYESLIWNKYEKGMIQFRAKMERLAKKVKLNQMFDKAARFYGANWPEDQPFVIALYPTPAKKGAASSQSLGSAESVGVLLDDNDLEGTFGVVFHELCHSLYSAQPIETQFQLEKNFLTLPSPYARHAYDLLNEGLATALGNGWAYELAAGKMDKHSWYNNHYIDGFSKAVYPLVKEYLSKGQTIDQLFVARASELLETKLPESLYDYSNLFQWIVALFDGNIAQRKEVREQIRKRFRVNSWDSHDPINGESSIKAAQESHKTLIVVYSLKEKTQLDKLDEKIPVIQDYLKLVSNEKKNHVFSTIDKSGRAFIIVQIQDTADIGKAFEFLKTKKKINPSQSLLYY